MGEENRSKSKKLYYWIAGLLFFGGMVAFSSDSNTTLPTSNDNASYQLPAAVEVKNTVPNKTTKPSSSQSNCHPSYSGCLTRYASDYDCAGGSGNGPYYTGPVRVTGPDVFGLDRDGDGWGCE